jgi:hypothetical protein
MHTTAVSALGTCSVRERPQGGPTAQAALGVRVLPKVRAEVDAT